MVQDPEKGELRLALFLCCGSDDFSALVNSTFEISEIKDCRRAAHLLSIDDTSIVLLFASKSAKETAMIKTIALLAIPAVVLSSSCAMARDRSGFNSYGALTPFDQPRTLERGASRVTAERADALRRCSGAAQHYAQQTWGVTQGQVYRSCMTRAGLAE